MKGPITDSKPFNLGGSVDFRPIPSGIYDVWVTTDAGYLPREGKEPGQLNDVWDSNYGNPRKMVVSNGSRATAFQFVPYVRVSNDTRIRDQWTHEWLSNCVVSFTATSGDIINKTYTNYPFGESKHCHGQPSGWSFSNERDFDASQL